MSLPVRSCLCRRHSERFGGPLGPRQWLRLLRRSTCSKRGSVRTVFFFFSSIGSIFFFWWSFITTVGWIRWRRHQIKGDTRWSVPSEHPGTCIHDSEIEFVLYIVWYVFFFQFLMRIVRVVLSLLFLSVFFLFFRIKHSMKEHDESSVKLQSQSFVVPINARAGTCRDAEWRERAWKSAEKMKA